MQEKSKSILLTISMFLLVACLVMPTSGWSQQVTAAINGQVTDPTGAPIANATVTARDVDRGTTLTTQSNSQGLYDLPRVPTGKYEVRAEAKGFQSAVQRDVELQVNQSARVDFPMKLGQVSETVEVTSAAPLLQSETTQLSTVINTSTIENLPLASRNYVQLTLLAPGSVTPAPSGFINGITTGLGPGGNDASRPYINGNREQANNFLLDGLDNNQVSDNLVGYTPNADAIQEFNLITQNASAEFGNFQGGIINATIKSGTNQFHGDVFEFFRNDALNANLWENNWGGLSKPPLRWNQFGATLGGPILKNKLFFFVDYQGERFDTPGSPVQTTVFTSAERAGNFSQLLTQQNIQLTNPFTGQPFVNNQIPASLIDPVAKNLFSASFYPAPLNGNLVNNFLNGTGTQINQDQGDVKVDYDLGTNDRIYGRYSRLWANDPSTNTFLAVPNAFTVDNAHNGVLDWTHTFGPTMVNEARAGVNYVLVNNGNDWRGAGNVGQDLGIANANIGGPGLLGLNFNGGNVASIGSNVTGSQQLFASTVIQLDDTLVITKGRHTIHTGFQFFRERINVYYAGNNGNIGSLTYTGQYSGSPESDFFLGLPTSFGGGSAQNGTWGQRSDIIAGYVQDDFHVRSNLTLNIGLRYENHTPWTEVDNREANFGLTSGQVYLAGQSCPYSNCNALYNSYNLGTDFQPRVGFAWTPGKLGGKTVVRGAYTMSSYLEGTGTNLRLTMNPPVRQPNFGVSYQKTASTPLPATTTDQGLIPPPAGDPFQGAEIRLWDPNVRPAVVQQWNFSIQQEFTKNTTLQVSYVGQKGTHLMQPMLYSEPILNSNGTLTPGPYLSGNPTLKDDVGVVAGTASAANQEYNALQAVMMKRYSSGLQLQVSYTYARCMTDSGGYYGTWGSTQGWFGPTYWQNLYDKRSEWGPCYYDEKHNLTTYALYELPFGKGRQFAKNMNPVGNAVLGGWNVSGILTLHTGFPMTPYTWAETAGVGLTNVFPYRAQCVGQGQILNENAPAASGGVGILWFNPSAFATPATGTFGNCGNGVIRGPGLKDLDLSVQKEFFFTERAKLQFRTDFINATNTPAFNAPNLGLGPTLGVITSTQGARQIQLALKFIF